VLATGGCRWEDVPAELGCSGRTAHRRLRAWEEAGVWDRLHADLLAALKRAGKLDLDTVIIDGVTVRAFGGGEAAGPSPTGDEALAAAILDRLLHKSVVLNIRGRSYRLQDLEKLLK
jgi:transposase